MLVVFKVDTSNENGIISKDHPIMIKRGTELDFDPIPKNVERLIKIGVAIVKEDETSTMTEDPGDQDPGSEQQDEDPGIALEDLTKAELESFIKENEIDVEIPAKATKAQIIELIEAALNK